MRADRAVRAVAIIAAAVFAVGNAAVRLPVKYRSVVSVDRHYGVSPSGQSVRGMQPPEIGPCGFAPPGHGSV